MSLKKVPILFGFAVVLMATIQIVFAEDVAVTSNQQSTLQNESDMQWAWGEVTDLDKQTNAITLKYLDYETDQEQELVLVVDEKTTFENIKDFNELKLKDTLSIDYMIGADNKNVAKNISFEKPDASSSVLPETTAADLIQPTAQSEIPVDSSLAVNETPASTESVPAVQEQAQ